MTITEILHQYKDVEPKNFGDFGEKCYPVTAVIKSMEQWAAQTHWTPITGEASLPTDDEALCLFVEWVNGIMTTSWITRCKEAKQEPNIEGYTHFTILQPPVKQTPL